MRRLGIVAVGFALVILTSGCGGEGQESAPASADHQSTATAEKRPNDAADESALARAYVFDICGPFAKYVESYMQIMALQTEGITSPDDLLQMGRRMKANAQARLAEFQSIEPPAAVQGIHEQLLTGLQMEIDGLEQLEVALQQYMRTGNKADLDQALAAVDKALTSAGVGPHGLEFENVPQAYLEAWERDCVPKLEQIPGAGD